MSIFYKGKQIAGNEVTLSEVKNQSKEEVKTLQKEGANQLAIVSKKVEEAVGVAIGTYLDIASNQTYTPSGYLLRDGAEYSKAQFSDLWENYLTSIEKEIVINPNVVIGSNCTVVDGLIQNNTQNDTVLFPNPNSGEEVILQFKASGDVESSQKILQITDLTYIGIENGLLTWFNGDGSIKTDTANNTFSIEIQSNNTFFIKVVGGDSSVFYSYCDISKDGQTWVSHSLKTGGTTISILLGDNNSFKGSINLLNSYCSFNDTVNYFANEKMATLLNTCTYSEYETDVATYGQCDKFAVDTENEKFRAPLANPNNRVLIEKKEPTESDPTWYNLYNDGWCEQGGTVISGDVASYIVTYPIGMADTNYTAFLSPIIASADDTEGDTSDIAVVSGIYNGSYPYGKTTSQLRVSTVSAANYGFMWTVKGYTNRVVEGSTRPYVVVANGELNQSDMDWSQWATSLEGKVDKGDMIPCATIIEWYESGTEGYILYSNNYCEQWGKAGRTAVSTPITLFKPYRDVNYGIMLQPYHTALSTDGRPPLVYNADTAPDGFTINLYTGYAGAYWRTYGFVQG